MKKTIQTPDMLKPLYRGLPIIIGIMTMSILAAKKYLRYTTPLYESTAKIKLADSKDGVPNNNLYKDFDVFTSTNKIGTELEVIKSQTLIEKAVKRLDIGISVFRVGEIHKKELYNESPIILTNVTLEKKLIDKPITLLITGRSNITLILPEGKTIHGKLNDMIRFQTGSLQINLNDSLLQKRPEMPVNDHYEFIVHSKAKQISTIIAGLDVTSVDKDIPVLRISYKSEVAQKSADIVNTVAATYIADYVEEKYRSADTTESFLIDQLKEYGDKLSSSEFQIQHYRDNKNIINIHQETETDLRKIADLKKQLASVRMNLEAVDSLNRYLRNGKEHFLKLAPNFEAFNDLLSTEIVKDMKRLQAEKQDLLTRFTPENEKVKVIDNKLDDLSTYLEESVKNTESNLRIKYNDLRQTIETSEQAFAGLPDKERNMGVLERNFSLNEQIYRFLQEKKTDAQIAKAATISFHRIISRGEVPLVPVSPNAKLIIVFSGFLGLLFSIIGIYVIHHAKGRVDNEQIIYRNTDTPLLYSLPYCANGTAKKQAFERWALELELQRSLEAGNVLTVSSHQAKEGKYFTASGLAKAIVALGKKVLLVSSNSKHETCSGYDMISPQQRDWHIPANWASLMEEWKKKYDIIIIENIPATESASMTALASASLNFFLLDSRITNIKTIGFADDIIEKLRLDNIGFVLNRAGYIPSLLTSIKRLIKRKKSYERG